MKPEIYTPEYLNRWTCPPSYFGAEWPSHYAFLSQHRDSDVLTRSNWRVAFAALADLPDWEGGDDAGEGTACSRCVVHESHWAVGWVEWIAIHETDVEALKLANKLLGRIESYPILDENDFSELEGEEALTIWRDCYSVKERIEYIRENRSQFEFCDFSDLLGCVRGNFFSGYASELIN